MTTKAAFLNTIFVTLIGATILFGLTCTPSASSVSALVSATTLARMASTEEIPIGDEIVERVKTAFLSKDFKALENMSQKFRVENQRSAIGRWPLEHFYAGTRIALILHNRQSDGHWTETEGLIDSWMNEYPTSPSAHIVFASALISHGWIYRRAATSSTGSEDGLETFYRYINEAYEHLQKTKIFASVDPRWYGVMMIVARAQHWERGKFESLLSEAFDRYPYFYQNYFSALQYFLPDWYGDINEVDRFINWAVERTESQYGMGMYAMLYLRVSFDQYDDIFGNTKVDWKKMKAGFEDIISRYPDPWNINSYARFAYLAGDKETGLELSSRVAEEPIVEAWRLGSFWPFWNWVRSIQNSAVDTCRSKTGHGNASQRVDLGNYGDLTIGEYDRKVVYGEPFIVTRGDISAVEGPRVRLKVSFGFQECNGIPADGVDVEIVFGRYIWGAVKLGEVRASFSPGEGRRFVKELSFPRRDGIFAVRINPELTTKEAYYDNNDRIVELKFVGFE